ncbi:unnamed protein product [Caenorhabditis brenneri]
MNTEYMGVTAQLFEDQNGLPHRLSSSSIGTRLLEARRSAALRICHTKMATVIRLERMLMARRIASIREEIVWHAERQCLQQRGRQTTTSSTTSTTITADQLYYDRLQWGIV